MLKPQTNLSESSNSNTDTPPLTNSISKNKVVTVRHQRFDGFDIYTAKWDKEHILFHKKEDKKMIIANVFKFLGSNEKLWLCEDIETKQIHIAPFDRFTQLK